MPTAVNIQTILPALEQLVEKDLRPQFEQEGPTYNMFAAGSAPFVNSKGWRIPSSLRPPTGVGGIGEGGSFKQPSAETNDDMYVSAATNMTLPFEYTGTALRNANDASSLIDGMAGLMKIRMEALQKEANIQTFDDGSGARAVYKSGTTTALMYNALDHTPLATPHSTKGAVQLQVGETYDWYSSDFATLRGTVQPTAKTNKAITIAAAISGATDGDILALSNSLYKVPRGLRYLVNNDTGLFQTQSRSAYPQLKAVVEDLNGAAITVSVFNKVKQNLENRAGVGKAKTVVAITSSAQDQALVQLGQNFKRWAGNEKTFDGSFQDFRHGDTVVKKDPDAGEDEIYLVVPSEIKKYQQAPLDMISLDGNKLRMRSGVNGYGSDSYTGVLGGWWNLGTPEPRCHALIKRASVAGLASQVGAYA